MSTNIYIYLYFNINFAVWLNSELWKESLNNDGQQYQQYQQIKQSPLASTHWTLKTRGSGEPVSLTWHK